MLGYAGLEGAPSDPFAHERARVRSYCETFLGYTVLCRLFPRV